MLSQADFELLDAMTMRFEDDYFVRSLGEHGIFCLPNFVATVEEGKILIQLLEHVSKTDEAKIQERLTGLPYKIQAGRTTLEKIEAQTGINFPDV